MSQPSGKAAAARPKRRGGGGEACGWLPRLPMMSSFALAGGFGAPLQGGAFGFDGIKGGACGGPLTGGGGALGFDRIKVEARTISTSSSSSTMLSSISSEFNALARR